MDAGFEKWYDEKVTQINLMRKRLAKNPSDICLKSAIQNEEHELFEYIVTSEKELQTLLINDDYGTED